MKKFISIFFFLFISLIFCSKKNATESLPNKEIEAPGIVDQNATYETKALYLNLKKMMGKGIMFGHQDDTAYGIDWAYTPLRSDVKEVCGSYPAVYGWDIGDIGNPANLDGVGFDLMKLLIKQAYKRGGINTVSMHIDNPVSGGDAWNVTGAVDQILPGGAKYAEYKKLLDLVADFFTSLKGDNGELIPVIFRPYHEHTGSWFWWGQNNCSKEEFIALWQFTVTYLRDEKNVHNLLYAYSPNGYISNAKYLERYPGDDFVDVFGLDTYNLRNNDQKTEFVRQLNRVVLLAQQRNKIPALTEVGLNKIPINNWWTEFLLKPIKSDSASKKIVYLLVWRNWTREHHFAPFPGHASVPDFLKFYQDPYTIFEDDLQDMYSY